MPRLIWSPTALRDVQRLHRFLAPKSLAVAKRAPRVLLDCGSQRVEGVG
jgi:plasmid stabilization system protein ParE